MFNGHVHAYERTHGMYDYQPDMCGPMYVTIGDGGNLEGPYRSFIDEQDKRYDDQNVTFCEVGLELQVEGRGGGVASGVPERPDRTGLPCAQG